MLSDRISALADDADQLCAQLINLVKEVEQMDGIEAVEHLADVPGDLNVATGHAVLMYGALAAAESDAKRGGLNGRSG